MATPHPPMRGLKSHEKALPIRLETIGIGIGIGVPIAVAIEINLAHLQERFRNR